MTTPNEQTLPDRPARLPLPDADLSGLVVLDFWAPWCGPCRAMNPALEQLDASGAVRVLKISMDEHPELGEALRIRAIPTLILAYDGLELARNVGAMTLPGMQGWVQAHAVTATGGTPR